MEKLDPALHILMRSDIKSMNPGKAMAQASHASNAFVFKMQKVIDEYFPESGMSNLNYHTLVSNFDAWKNSTNQGFGTALVYKATKADIDSVEKLTMADNLVLFEKILDPTYPVQDGDERYYVPVITCAYLFGDRTHCKEYIKPRGTIFGESGIMLHP